MKYQFISAADRKAVFDVLRNHYLKLQNNLTASGSIYDNDMGCGNCGDVGPVYKNLLMLAESLGFTKKERMRIWN